MTFGDAIEEMKAGRKVWRKGWNGKGMWVIYVPGTKNVITREGSPYHEAGFTEEIEILPHFDMYTVNSGGRRAILPGWLHNQTWTQQIGFQIEFINNSTGTYVMTYFSQTRLDGGIAGDIKYDIFKIWPYIRRQPEQKIQR